MNEQDPGSNGIRRRIEPGGQEIVIIPIEAMRKLDKHWSFWVHKKGCAWSWPMPESTCTCGMAELKREWKTALNNEQ